MSTSRPVVATHRDDGAHGEVQPEAVPDDLRGDRVDDERHVVGHDVDDGVRRAEAVLLEVRGVHRAPRGCPAVGRGRGRGATSRRRTGRARTGPRGRRGRRARSTARRRSGTAAAAPVCSRSWAYRRISSMISVRSRDGTVGMANPLRPRPSVLRSKAQAKDPSAAASPRRCRVRPAGRLRSGSAGPSADPSSGNPRSRDRASSPACHSDRPSTDRPAADARKNSTARAIRTASTVRMSCHPNSGGTVMLPGSGGVGTGTMGQRCASTRRSTPPRPVLSPARARSRRASALRAVPRSGSSASPLRVSQVTRPAAQRAARRSVRSSRTRLRGEAGG